MTPSATHVDVPEVLAGVRDADIPAGLMTPERLAAAVHGGSHIH